MKLQLLFILFLFVSVQSTWPFDSSEDPARACEWICRTFISFTAFIDVEIKLNLTLPTLISKTKPFCHRICLLPEIQLELLKFEREDEV
jgi:hypothetical protein